MCSRPGYSDSSSRKTVDDRRRRTDQPCFLTHAFFDGRHAGRCARRAPRSALLVGVAHEAEWRKPLVALVVIGTHSVDGFLQRIGQIQPGAPGQVLAGRKVASNAGRLLTELAEDLAGDQLAVHGDHAFDAVLDHERNGLAAGDGLPHLDRTIDGSRHQRHILAAGSRDSHVAPEWCRSDPCDSSASSLKALNRISICSRNSAALASASRSGPPSVSTSRV